MVSSLIDKYKKLSVQIKASLWFLVCTVIQNGISALTTPIFTRILTPAEYGKYSDFNHILNIVSIFVTLNLSLGVYNQGLVKFEEDKDNFSSSLQCLTFILLIFWTIIYLCFNSFFNQLLSLTTTQVLAMLLLIWTGAVSTFWASYQKVDYKYRALVILTIVVSVLKPLLSIFLIQHSEDKVTARILGFAIIEFLGYGFLFIIQMKKGKKWFDFNYWKYAVLFNLPLIPHYLSQTLLNGADQIMIGRFCGNAQEGIYGLAYSLSLLMTIFNSALMQTLSPWIYKQIKAKNISGIAPIAYICFIGVAILNLGLITLAPEVVAIFAPKAYHEAIYVIPPIAMSVYFMFSYDLFAKFAFYYEKTKFVMLASLSGAILNIVLNYIAIPMFGYKAAGYTTLICYMIYSIGHYIFMNKVCVECCEGKKPYSLNTLLYITIPFLICGFILFTTYNYPVVRYAIVVVALVVMFMFRAKIIEIIKKIYSLKEE